MHMFVYFLAGCRKRLLVLDCPSQRFAELCIFDGSKIFQKYAFFHGKMHSFFAFRLAAENAYSIFRWFCPKTKVFIELCIFDGSKIFLKYAFFLRKMNMFLLFGWPQKMRFCRNFGMYFTKRWKYAFSHGRMHVWKILEPSNMHIQRNVDLDNRGQVSVFCSQPKNIQTYAFSHGKTHILGKSWSHQKCILKMHIFCVLFLRPFKNA